MTRLLTTGFEENDFTATMWSVAPVGSTIVSTGTPHSGTFHMQSVAAANAPNGPKRDLAAATGSTTLYTRVYWKAGTLPTSGTTTSIFSWRDNGNAAMFQILHVRATNKLRINNSKNANTTADTANAISSGTYYRLEVEHIQSATVGSITLNLYTGDSTTLLDSAALTSQNTGTNAFTFVMNSTAGENQGHTWFFDDVAINDANGTFQNFYAGPGSIALINPTSDVSVTWTKAGSAPAGTNFGGVAEVPGTPDDGTTYNEDSGTSNVDRLGLSALPAEVTSDAVIAVVDVYARCQAGAASQSLILRLWDHTGASTDGPTVSLANGVWNFVNTASHLAFNGATYTKANVNSFNAGYKGASGISAKRVTSVWVNVDWTPFVASGGPLMGPFNQYNWPLPAPKPTYMENRSWIGLLSYYGLDQFFGDTGQPPTYEMFNPGLGPPRPNLGTTQASNFNLLTQALPPGVMPGAPVTNLPPRGPQPINVGATYGMPIELLTILFLMPRFNGAGQPDFPNPLIPRRNAALGTWINPSTVLPSAPPAGTGDANWVPTWMPRRGR